MGNSLFVVWRESIEAMLVIGILYAWVRRNGDAADRRALWGGVVAGLALALLLGGAMLGVQDELSGAALEGFQIAILFIAAGLIVQMVLWMHQHGRRMKQNLEQGLSRAVASHGSLGIGAVAALAIAREGAETVIFLYGMGLEPSARGTLVLGAVLGFLLAAFTAWAVNRGLRFLDYRQFFRVSGFLLLLLAAGLLVAGIERLVGLGWLPPLVDPLWDTSAVLDDSSGTGALLSAFTGYRARPSLLLAAAYLAYWAGVLLMQRRLSRHA